MITLGRILFRAVIILCINQSIMAQKLQPNVVLILADDMGWGDLHINGNKIIETPAIDRIGCTEHEVRQVLCLSALCSHTG